MVLFQFRNNVKKFMQEQEQKNESSAHLINDLIEQINKQREELQNLSAKNESSAQMINELRENIIFLAQPQKRIMFIGNMSAGKSTLINAIIGKKLLPTANEACTSNINFIYNKPFDDNCIHLNSTPLDFTATCKRLAKGESSEVCEVALYFKTTIKNNQPVCIIDTPGVNSAINPQHQKITRKAILEEKYHQLIYVLNADQLGTQDEQDSLKFVFENVAQDKILFVINKVDKFHPSEDNLDESIKNAEKDLLAIGYENPKIYPVSAYFAYLIKSKIFGQELSEDEIDEYLMDSKKFTKPEYDLSKYYGDSCDELSDNEIISMSKKSGILGFEKILFGG